MICMDDHCDRCNPIRNISTRVSEIHDTCIHNNAILCTEIKELEERTDIHCKTINHLSFKINQLKSSLREFELERVNPKFEELEEKINNREILCPSMDLIITMRQTIETWQTGCEVIINEMQKKIDELEERDQRVKTPHKCPVCDGEGCRYVTNFFINDIIEEEIKSIKCISCEGKGIVWG